MNVRFIENAIWFQIGWWLCVIYGNTAALGVSVTTLLIYRCFFQKNWREWRTLGMVVVLGLVLDTILGFSEVLIFPSYHPFPPFWLITLWLLFATTLHHSVSPLFNRPKVFIAFCGFGGTLSYFAGVKLTSVELGYGIYLSLSLLFLAWLCIGVLVQQIYQTSLDK